jgi:hypothetical protein
MLLGFCEGEAAICRGYYMLTALAQASIKALFPSVI